MAAAKEVDIVFVVQHLGVGGVSNSSIDLISLHSLMKGIGFM